MAAERKEKMVKKLQKTYFDVLGLCCSSEVPLIQSILKALDGIKEFSVIVPSRTVIVVHDSLVISQAQIVKALNQARFEANVRTANGTEKLRRRMPSPNAMVCGVLLLLALLKFVYRPLEYLALGAVAAGAYRIILKALASIRNLRLDINILMLIAVTATIAMADYLEAGTIVFLSSIAEWLESMASHKASAAMSSLTNIAPQKAVIAETGEAVDADEVTVNTIVAIKAGEVIPIDGIVVEGICEVDEKTLSGESYPVLKQKDSPVWAGTINLNGYIDVKTTTLYEDCVVAKMAKLVEEAQNSKTSTQRSIDKFAKFYTPAVVVVSTLLAVIPLALRVKNQRHWFHFALVVLVSACPCALILSTPVATFCAYTKAAKSGLLIKGGDYLETLAKIKVMAFDKTGTITKGEFLVSNFQSLCDDIDLNTLLQWVTSIESKSSHPIAGAIVDYGRSLSIEPKPEKVTEFENFPGEGIHGKIDGRDIYIGNRKIVTRAGSEPGDILVGKTTGFIYSEATPIGFFSLTDACRSGAQEAIGQLKSLNIKTSMLTGDSQAAAMQAYGQLGHVLEVVHAELIPEDKAKIIKEFKKEGPTAMVGDGINDAPALAVADIGISMGISGSALASETGNIILMSNDLRKIPQAIKLARKSHKKVIENIMLSAITKAAILGLAIAGHPVVWAAVLADVGTCVLVILNSMLLLNGSSKHKGKCCRPSIGLHIHKDGCKAPNDKFSCHHHHEHRHQQQNHHHCFSDEKKVISHPNKCASKCQSSPAFSGSCGHSMHGNIMGTHAQCKVNAEFHEAKHYHHGSCDKNQDGVHLHDVENLSCLGSHNMDVPVEEKHATALNSIGCLEHSKSHETVHCHNGNCDMGIHGRPSLISSCHLNSSTSNNFHQFGSKHCHLITGCENAKCHAIGHQNPDSHSESAKKHQEDHVCVEIDNEHIKSASMQSCMCLEEQESGSCHNGCAEECKTSTVACTCECSNDRQVDACCISEGSSKKSTDFSVAHACASLDKRGRGACCKSYMKKCCGKDEHLHAGFVGGLSDIAIE
ncbi:putative inactive cadmium/zinc-transporting ATPase HMA3 isoform X2 [Prosopis cineraria]|uniref:putative inactive cadmium/zinc-transporting ATPase HMA3 isoform X2 n=1 Tax=Prosopis cineraria TaxID=364024 RepID=UPI00241079F7|nr:putative inactive cadmium/zinc-transporting ATPase HMA3 isoform X2 [Prosopis cineraria]